MRNAVRELVQQLQNPETASSFIPLTVVVGVFLLASAGSLYFFFRALRVPHEEPGADPKKKKLVESLLTLLNPDGKFRNFLGRMWGPEEERVKALLAQIEELRARIARLEEENSGLRQQHAASLRHVTELSDSLKDMENKWEETKKTLETATYQRDKIQKRADELEVQLRDVMKEIDDLYQQNAKALDTANERREKAQKRADEVEHHLNDFVTELERLYRGGNDLSAIQSITKKTVGYNPSEIEWQRERERLVAAHAEEVKKLKDLLQVCRDQILAFTRRANSDEKKSA